VAQDLHCIGRTQASLVGVAVITSKFLKNGRLTMKHFTSRILASTLLACSVGAMAEEPEAPYSFSGNVALTTDYAFRGISQTDEDPAIQGGFNFNHQSGFYAGVWASNIDFSDANIEIDYFGGLTGKFTEDLGWDVGAIYYDYPGSEDDLDIDYLEVYAGLSYKIFALKYYYSDDFSFDSGNAGYLDAALNVPLPNDFGVVLHVGHQSIDDNAAFGVPDYTDYKIGINKKLAGFTFDLSYTDTDIDEDDCAGGLDVCDGRAIFTISRAL
jgi:uncharacterized protein (TIGR02001 family)